MAEPSVIYDVKGLLRDLEGLTPGLKKQLIRDAKAIGKPIAAVIKSQIPTTAPLSGMANNGRLGWGSGKPANSVTVKFRSGRSRYTAVTPLVSVWVNSPMTAVADIAGKGNMRKAKRVTSEYAYKDGSRRHQVTSQGRWMIRGLRERNLNNFVYPNVEDRLDDAQAEVKLIIDKYARMVNRKLN
jgi:hypothetical protein